MVRCSRCILPDTFPDIHFDANGVCHRCHADEKRYLSRDLPKLKRELEDIFAWAKAQGKKYDCIVPFSGGKDSSYTLYICAKVYGLKTMAVNFNNGLRTPAALNNIEKIIKSVGCASACYGPPWDVMKKLYTQFFKQTGQFCFPCDMGIWATMHRVAEMEDIPLIVSGFSAQIESRGAKIYSYNNHLFKTISSPVLSDGEAEDFLEVTRSARMLRRLKHFRITRYRRQISLPDYMEWNDKEIKRVITDVLGWEPASDGSTDHVDCRFAPIKNYLVMNKWGFGEKTTKYASMVRAGQLDREMAIKRATEEESVTPTKALNEFMAEFDLTMSDIEAARQKSHLNFLG